jgi:hypothetical protein
MKSKCKSITAALLFGAVAIGASRGADASVTLYTSQSAFDAAAPSASAFGFDAGGAISVTANPLVLNGLSFSDNVTAADIANSGTPLLFLIDATDTPTYGQDFLSYQNTQVGISAEIDSAGVTAIGFSYGSYLPTGDAVLTLSTGDSFTITPTSVASFIGFTSTARITSLTVDYPDSYAFDLLGVSSTTPVPEPATWTMMLVGFGGLGGALRARRRGHAAAA